MTEVARFVRDGQGFSFSPSFLLPALLDGLALAKALASGHVL